MTPVKSLNHIGIAVRSLADQQSFYGDTLGAEYEGVEEVPSQKVRVAFYKLNEVRLELLEPTDSESPIAKFIEKRGEGLHHIAFTVDDLQSRIKELQRGGITMIDETPRPGAHQMQIAFIHPKSSNGVLTELCQLP